MYVIRLHNCAFFARHGALEEEKTLGQRFFVDVEMTIDADAVFASDRVEDTLHYGEAFKLVERVVTGERFNTIEALAHTIGRRLGETYPQITVVEVTVRKPQVPIDGVLDFVSATVVIP